MQSLTKKTTPEILQGTTPTLRIKFQTTDAAVTDFTKIELTFRYGRTEEKHDLDDPQIELDADENTISYNFTEAETLGFTVGEALYYQVRAMLQSGKILGTRRKTINIVDLMSEDVLSG